MGYSGVRPGFEQFYMFLATFLVERKFRKRGTHALLLVAVELDRAHDGAPLAELVHPVVQRGLGHDDHVRAGDAAVLVQVAQQRDRLQRLAEALRDRR